jgi:hypothetical protein
MLPLLAAFLAFGLPLHPWRAAPPPPSRRTAPLPHLKRARRAPLAEHGWEARVLRNLTTAE